MVRTWTVAKRGPGDPTLLQHRFLVVVSRHSREVIPHDLWVIDVNGAKMWRALSGRVLLGYCKGEGRNELIVGAGDGNYLGGLALGTNILVINVKAHTQKLLCHVKGQIEIVEAGAGNRSLLALQALNAVGPARLGAHFLR